MAAWGSNPDALREVATMCKFGAEIAELRKQLLERAIQILQASAYGHWVRPYIEMLRQVIKILEQVKSLLAAYQQMLGKNAGQQDAASDTRRPGSTTSGRNDGGGGGGSGSSGSGKPATSEKGSNVLQDLTNLLKAGKELLDTLNKEPEAAATDQAAAATRQPEIQQPVTEQKPPATTDTRVPEAQVTGEPVAPPAHRGIGSDPLSSGQASRSLGGGGGGGLGGSPAPAIPGNGLPGETVLGHTQLGGQGGVPSVFTGGDQQPEVQSRIGLAPQRSALGTVAPILGAGAITAGITARLLANKGAAEPEEEPQLQLGRPIV